MQTNTLSDQALQQKQNIINNIKIHVTHQNISVYLF